MHTEIPTTQTHGFVGLSRSSGLIGYHSGTSLELTLQVRLQDRSRRNCSGANQDGCPSESQSSDPAKRRRPWNTRIQPLPHRPSLEHRRVQVDRVQLHMPLKGQLQLARAASSRIKTGVEEEERGIDPGPLPPHDPRRSSGHDLCKGWAPPFPLFLFPFPLFRVQFRWHFYFCGRSRVAACALC